MHDTVLQTLGQIAQRAADRSGHGRLREINGLAVQRLEKLNLALIADDVRGGGLADELQRLVREYHDRLDVRLVTAKLVMDPPAAVVEALVGAVREALVNVIKHAGVSHVVVRAADAAGGVEIVVRDQGRGFPTDSDGRGFGLDESIRRRMHDVGGEMEIWSEPGRGTRVQITWPGEDRRQDTMRPSGPES